MVIKEIFAPRFSYFALLFIGTAMELLFEKYYTAAVLLLIAGAFIEFHIQDKLLDNPVKSPHN